MLRNTARILGTRVTGLFTDDTAKFERFHDNYEDPENSNRNKPPKRAESTELSCLTNGSLVPNGVSGGGGTPGEHWQNRELSYVGGSTQDEVQEDDSKKERNSITHWQAGWNVTNAIQGMFIVTFPYAVGEGGYWALLAMVLIAWICCYTGKILVDCLYENNASGVQERVRNSYVEIAEAVWGKTIGGRIVNAAQMVELLMTCILYILLCGDLMLGSFPDTPLDLPSWILLSSTLLLPCAFLKSLRHVSFLSFWCTVAHMFINGIIIIYCLTKVNEWQWDSVQIKIDIWTFPISLGIVIFSYTSQIFLPTLEGNLVDRTKFSSMMHWTHAAAGVFKVLFSWIGFITWGMATKEVITNNLPNRTLKIIVNLFLWTKALLSYPLPYYASVEQLQQTFFRGRPRTVLPSCLDEEDSIKMWAIVLRLALVIFTVFMAIFIPHFNILMGLIGSFTGNMLSLVWPCYFHLKIKGHSLKWYSKAIDCTIILFGVVCALLGVYYSTHALVLAFQGIEPRPYQSKGSLPVQAKPLLTSSSTTSTTQLSPTSTTVQS